MCGGVVTTICVLSVWCCCYGYMCFECVVLLLRLLVLCCEHVVLLQLYMVRTMLESLIGEKQIGRRQSRKELHPKDVTAFELFHKQSFFWSYLLNLNGKTVDLHILSSKPPKRWTLQWKEALH